MCDICDKAYLLFLQIFYLQTEYFFEPFIMKMYFGAGLKIPPGRKRMVFILTAIDVNNVRRPNGICFEIKGEFVKV